MQLTVQLSQTPDMPFSRVSLSLVCQVGKYESIGRMQLQLKQSMIRLSKQIL
jgi:hypothetical protein